MPCPQDGQNRAPGRTAAPHPRHATTPFAAPHAAQYGPGPVTPQAAQAVPIDEVTAGPTQPGPTGPRPAPHSPPGPTRHATTAAPPRWWSARTAETAVRRESR